MSKQLKVRCLTRLTKGQAVIVRSESGATILMGHAQMKRLERSGYIYDTGTRYQISR